MSAGLQTTLPLVLGLGLETGSFTLLAEAGPVAITGQDATLSAPSSGADIGTSWPLILGSLLATEGSSAFTILAGAGSVPITGQAASLASSYEPADTGTTWPLALGLNLTSNGFTLTAEAGNVAITFAGSESTEFEGPGAGGGAGGGGKKKKFIQKVGDKIVVFESATAAARALDSEPVVISAQKSPPKDAVKVEAVELPKLKATARAFGHEQKLMAMLKAQQYQQMLELHRELQNQQDEEDIELLALWA